MQRINSDIIKMATKVRMKKLEDDMAATITNAENSEMIICPVCKYVGKNKRGTAKVFHNSGVSGLKCFSCGIWRRI